MISNLIPLLVTGVVHIAGIVSIVVTNKLTDKLIIRTSDRVAFRRCRQSWDLGSKIRLNYEYVPGIEPLDFGTAIHAGLEVYYDPRRWGEDRIIVQQESLLGFSNHMVDWRARLKKAGHWDMSQKMWQDNARLGTGMLNHFFTWAPKHDVNWEPLKAEIEFEVPIPVPDDYRLPPVGWANIGNQLYHIDEDYEPIPVVYQGRIDLVVKDIRTGAIYIVDHKTAGQLGDYEHLELDTQVSSYAWALEKVLGLKISGVIFQELRKKAPEEPRTLKNGGLSRARDQNTTAEIYRETVRRLGMPMAEYQEFIDFLALEGQVYFRRIQIERSAKELEIVERNVLDEALDMLDNPRIYPNPNRFNCGSCQFHEVCVMRQDGSDWKFYLDDSIIYEKRGEEV